MLSKNMNYASKSNLRKMKRNNSHVENGDLVTFCQLEIEQQVKNNVYLNLAVEALPKANKMFQLKYNKEKKVPKMNVLNISDNHFHNLLN